MAAPAAAASAEATDGGASSAPSAALSAARAVPEFASDAGGSSPVLILNANQTRQVLSMEACIQSQRRGFLAAFHGDAVVPSRLMIDVPGTSGTTLFKPALVGARDLGLKVVSVRPKNSPPIPTIPGAILLIHADTGLPAALLDGTFITGRRTAAGSAVATDVLAPKDGITSLVVFGAGLQAEEHIRAMLTVRPTLANVTIVNRSADRARELAKRFEEILSSSEQFQSVRFVALSATAQADAVSAAVADADLICLTTPSTEPVISAGQQLKPHVHINAIGSFRPTMIEVDRAVVASLGGVVIDSAGALGAAGELRELSADSPLVYGDLGKLLADQAPLTAAAEALRTKQTLFKSVGVAHQDITAAAEAFARAQELKLGTSVFL